MSLIFKILNCTCKFSTIFSARKSAAAYNTFTGEVVFGAAVLFLNTYFLFLALLCARIAVMAVASSAYHGSMRMCTRARISIPASESDDGSDLRALSDSPSLEAPESSNY